MSDVMPLKWFEARVSDKWERYSAESIFGNYEALEWSNGGHGGTLAPVDNARGVEFDANSIPHAKDICEKDYAARVIALHGLFFPKNRLATLETAVLTIIKAMQSYLPPDSGVTEKDFISEVIEAVDNPAVFAALHGTSDAGSDSLKRALERGR